MSTNYATDPQTDTDPILIDGEPYTVSVVRAPKPGDRLLLDSDTWFVLGAKCPDPWASSINSLALNNNYYGFRAYRKMRQVTCGYHLQSLTTGELRSVGRGRYQILRPVPQPTLID